LLSITLAKYGEIVWSVFSVTGTDVELVDFDLAEDVVDAPDDDAVTIEAGCLGGLRCFSFLRLSRYINKIMIITRQNTDSMLKKIIFIGVNNVAGFWISSSKLFCFQGITN